MERIIEIIEELRRLSGGAQMDYLKANKDVPHLKEILQYTYDTKMLYKMSDAKINKATEQVLKLKDEQMDNDMVFVLSVPDEQDWITFRTILDRLSSQKGVKDSEVFDVIYYLHANFQPRFVDLFKGILLKDHRINMGVSLFNKVWEDFSVEWAYMGCRGYKEKNIKNIVYPAYAQTKMDGLYCNCVMNLEDDSVKYISRQGKPINIYGILDKYVREIDFGESFVLNGEVVIIQDGKFLPREISNGIIKGDDKTQEQIDGMRLVVWDAIPLKDYLIGKWDVSYERRFNALKIIEANAGGKIITVETETVNSREEAMECFNRHYEKGEEGIVLKNKRGIWKDGKGRDQVKIKSEKDCDLKMIGFIEGKGRYVGKCGSIQCVSSDGKLEVYVKPRTPADADYVWANQDECMGKILAVKYNEKIKSPSKKLYSLYLPIFIEIRDDKVVANSLGEIE